MKTFVFWVILIGGCSLLSLVTNITGFLANFILGFSWGFIWYRVAKRLELIGVRNG